MERQVIFADYQEQTAADHNNLQDYARETFDDLVRDAVTPGRLYAGFSVTKSAQAEVTVSPGRIVDQGAIAKRRTALVQSVATYLAAASQKMVLVSAFLQENLTDETTRDFLIDVDNDVTEARAVQITRSRDAVIVFTAGAEGVDPQLPPVPATHVPIAAILVDTTQVVSITMLEANRVKSLAEHETRLSAQENFKEQIEPRVTALASDLSALSVQAGDTSTREEFATLSDRLAEINAKLDVPGLALDYQSDDFSSDDGSDVDDSAGLGYDAVVDQGVRFPLANTDVKAIDIFSANDPNASLSGGILLPRYVDDLKLTTGTYQSQIGMSQYGFQTTELIKKTISKVVLRYGGYWPLPIMGRKSGALRARYREKNKKSFYYESYTQTYWDEVTTNHTVEGAIVGQTFLVANDTWATKLGFYVNAKAAAEDIWVTLCEVTNGQPDKSKAILVQAYPEASIVTGWNRMPITPTFLESGKRYALVLVSNANHKLGMSSGQSYVDGTFFYSTDGEFFLGDLTKDLMIEVWGAKFDNAQVAIELEAINLDGGIDSLDLQAGAVVPFSTELIYKVQPNGSGAWVPLNETNVSAFVNTPPLCRFQAVFVGTRDMQPGIKLTGSEVQVFRPKVAVKHVSEALTFAVASDEVRVKLTTAGFDPAVHTLACQLRVGTETHDADVEAQVVRDAEDGAYEITYSFNLAAETDTATIIISGSTPSAKNTFVVEKRDVWVL